MFTSLDCVKYLALHVFKLPFDLSVATPAKEKLVTSIASFNCPLVYHGALNCENVLIFVGQFWVVFYA